MMKGIMLCMPLIVLSLGMAIPAQEGQAQTISWDALFVTGVDSHYKAFYQTLPLWQFGGLAIEGGIGVTAWRYWDWCYWKGDWDWQWCWFTYPSLLTRARISLFAEPMIDVYSLSWLSASIEHDGKLLPKFRRIDLFTAVGIEFHLSPSLSIHGELGFPIGWDRVYTTIGIGFSLQF